MPTLLRKPPRLVCVLMLSLTALAACSVDTGVSITGTTPARVQHLYLTVAEVWLNTSATAAAADSGWVGARLNSPLSIDLANLNDGSLQTLLSGIKTPAGTYRQLRLVIEDSSASLGTSAQAAGLASNAEVRYLDAASNSVTLPLELASPVSQLTLQTALVLNNPAAAQLAQSSGTAAAAAPAAEVVIDLEANRNLLLFNYGSRAAALLNAAGAVYDAAKVGAISGTLDVSSIPAATLTGVQGIVVTAETLSSDSSRFDAVKSVAVRSNGAFTLFPLPVADTGTTTYDLVIHGPGIRTVIITKVPVSAGSASAATIVQTNAIGLASATHYTVNTAANSVVLPGGSRAGFYQTLPGQSAPHLIEYAPIDPFTGGFDNNLSLSADAIDFGVHAAGSSISFGTSSPSEGIGIYRIAAAAPLRPAMALSTTISAPAALTAAVQPIFLPQIATPGNAASISGTLNAGRAGRFDNGFLLVSRGGAIIDTRDLGPALAGAAASGSANINFTLSGLPGAVDDAHFDVSVRLWNSADPAATLARAAAATQADLSRGSAAGLLITVP